MRSWCNGSSTDLKLEAANLAIDATNAAAAPERVREAAAEVARAGPVVVCVPRHVVLGNSVFGRACHCVRFTRVFRAHTFAHKQVYAY